MRKTPLTIILEAYSAARYSSSLRPGRPATPQCSAPEKPPEASPSLWTGRGRGWAASATLWFATTESAWLEGPEAGPSLALLREAVVKE